MFTPGEERNDMKPMYIHPADDVAVALTDIAE